MDTTKLISRVVSSALLTLAIGCTDGDQGLDASSVDVGGDSGVRMDSGAVLDSGPGDLGATDLGPLDAAVTDAVVEDVGMRDSGPLLDSGCVASQTAASPQYLALPEPGRPRSLHAAARLPNGQVLIAGGFSDGLDFDPDVELFDPSTDTTTVGPSRPLQRTNVAAVPLSDGRIFVSSGPGQPALLYDQTGGWTRTATAPDLYTTTFVPLSDSRVLAIGGLDGLDGNSSDEVHAYDPASDTWSLFLRLLVPRLEPAAVDLEDGRIFVIGGSSGPNMGINTTEFIDVAAATSAPGPMLRVRRSGPKAVLLLDRRVLILGGEPLNGLPTEIYDPATQAFEAIPGRAPPSKVGAALVRLCDGRVAELGGRMANNPLGDSQAWLFDPVLGSWSATNANMPTRQSPSATLLLDGRVLVFGGSLLTDPQPLSAYLFVPDVAPR